MNCEAVLQGSSKRPRNEAEEHIRITNHGDHILSNLSSKTLINLQFIKQAGENDSNNLSDNYRITKIIS